MPRQVRLRDLPGGPVDIEFSDEISRRCTCTKCRMVAMMMYVDPNQHIFCQHCIDECSLVKKIYCSEERKDIEFKEMEEAFSVMTILMKMKVYCPNRRKGCDVTPDFMSLKDHFMECDKTLLKCECCRKSLKGTEYKNHRMSCSEKLVQCSYCFDAQPLISLREHKKRCGEEETRCPKCTDIILRKELTMHEYQCTGVKQAKQVQYKSAETEKAVSRPQDVPSAPGHPRREYPAVEPAVEPSLSLTDSVIRGHSVRHDERSHRASETYGMSSSINVQDSDGDRFQPSAPHPSGGFDSWEVLGEVRSVEEEVSKAGEDVGDVSSANRKVQDGGALQAKQEARVGRALWFQTEVEDAKAAVVLLPPKRDAEVQVDGTPSVDEGVQVNDGQLRLDGMVQMTLEEFQQLQKLDKRCKDLEQENERLKEQYRQLNPQPRGKTRYEILGRLASPSVIQQMCRRRKGKKSDEAIAVDHANIRGRIGKRITSGVHSTIQTSSANKATGYMQRDKTVFQQQDGTLRGQGTSERGEVLRAGQSALPSPLPSCGHSYRVNGASQPRETPGHSASPSAGCHGRQLRTAPPSSHGDSNLAHNTPQPHGIRPCKESPHVGSDGRQKLTEYSSSSKGSSQETPQHGESPCAGSDGRPEPTRPSCTPGGCSYKSKAPQSQETPPHGDAVSIGSDRCSETEVTSVQPCSYGSAGNRRAATASSDAQAERENAPSGKRQDEAGIPYMCDAADAESEVASQVETRIENVQPAAVLADRQPDEAAPRCTTEEARLHLAFNCRSDFTTNN